MLCRRFAQGLVLEYTHNNGFATPVPSNYNETYIATFHKREKRALNLLLWLKGLVPEHIFTKSEFSKLKLIAEESIKTAVKRGEDFVSIGSTNGKYWIFL